MNMQTNHVVACLGGDKTALETRPLPDVGPGELLLDLRVVGFCGTDLFKLDTGAAGPGTVLGHELVGEVAAVGGGVTDFKPGDRVAVPHHVPCGECLVCRRGNETMCWISAAELRGACERMAWQMQGSAHDIAEMLGIPTPEEMEPGDAATTPWTHGSPESGAPQLSAARLELGEPHR